ncbi:MAG: acyl-CoA dehydrogenase family protein [Solirubrobacterales bacterium]
MNRSAALRAASPERLEIVEVARELGRRTLAPAALDLDERKSGALDAVWKQVVEVGFDRALAPTDNDGAGLDAETLLLCLEEIAAGDGGIAMLVLLSNAALVVLPPELLTKTPASMRWALLPAPPEELPTGARVTVEKRSGATTLSGRLCPALGALCADGIVVVTREPEPAVLAFPDGTGDVEMTLAEPQLGLRSAVAACISFSGAKAAVALPPADAVVAAAQSMALLRGGAAAIARGIARRAQEMALAYAEMRFQGGVPIVAHDAVREMLAGMAVRLASAPCPPATPDAAAASVIAVKVANTDAAVTTTTDAVQVFGGTGYMHETGIEKLMRDTKMLQLWPEPNWVGRKLVAGALSGRAGAVPQS